MGKATKRKLKRRKLARSKSLTAPARTNERQGALISRWLLPVILLTTFLAFLPVLTANFVNLDDNEYVTENPLVKRASNLGSLLVTPVQGNYHPLTMLTLSINHMISGNDAWSYHLLNLLLHLINCFLVFQLAMLLSNRNTVMAFTVVRPVFSCRADLVHKIHRHRLAEPIPPHRPAPGPFVVVETRGSCFPVGTALYRSAKKAEIRIKFARRKNPFLRAGLDRRRSRAG